MRLFQCPQRYPPLQPSAPAHLSKCFVGAGLAPAAPAHHFLLTHPGIWGLADASQDPAQPVVPPEPPHLPLPALSWWDWVDQGPLFRAGAVPAWDMWSWSRWTCSGREGGERASKQQKNFQKLMPWALPTFLVLMEPTHFSAMHKLSHEELPGAQPGSGSSTRGSRFHS